MLTRQVQSAMTMGPDRLYDASDHENVIQDVNVASLLGAIQQLGTLSQYSAELFGDIQQKVGSINQRAADVQKRLGKLQKNGMVRMASIIKKAKTGPEDFVTKETPLDRSLKPHFNLFTPETRPKKLREDFKKISPPPNLGLLDKYLKPLPQKKLPRVHRNWVKTGEKNADDEFMFESRSQLCLYSDPEFFRREWERAELARNVQAQKRRRQRKEKRKNDRIKEIRKKEAQEAFAQQQNSEEPPAAPMRTPPSPALSPAPSPSVSSSQQRPQAPPTAPTAASPAAQDVSVPAPERAVVESPRSAPSPPATDAGTPPPRPQRNSNASRSPPPKRQVPPPRAAPAQPAAPAVQAEAAAAPAPAAAATAVPEGFCKAREHPDLVKFFKQMKVLPPNAVKRNMGNAGLDPNLLDTPDKHVKQDESLKKARKKKGGGQSMADQMAALKTRLAKAKPKAKSKAKKTLTLLDQIRNAKARKLKKVDKAKLRRRKLAEEQKKKEAEEKRTGHKNMMDILAQRRQALDNGGDSDSDFGASDEDDW